MNTVDDVTGPQTGTDEPDIGDKVVELGSAYALTSDFSITAAALAPEPAYELLSDLNDDPGQALVTLAEAAGVPAAELLFDALPSSLRSRVAGWMSDAVGSDGLAEVQVLMAWSKQVLTVVQVQSSLRIADVKVDGTADASHDLDAIIFHIDGKLVEEDIPSIDSLPGAGHALVELRTVQEPQGLRLELGEHRFGLLFGEAAYRALESAIAARYGQNMRALLSSAIDCGAMAEKVAQQCVLGVCVGHKIELAGLCEGALDSAVERIHDQFTALDTELLVLKSGSAEVRASANQGSALVDGSWTAQAELGQGLRSLPASFAAESF